VACELVEPRQFAAKQSVIREIMLQAEEQLTGAGNVFLTDVGDGQKNASKGREKATLRRRQLKFRNAALFVALDAPDAQQPSHRGSHRSDDVSAHATRQVGVKAGRIYGQNLARPRRGFPGVVE